MSTPLYERTLAYDYGDKERSDLMAKVWTVTPYMVNVKTGSPTDETFMEIREWCTETFGREAWPIHGYEGSWQTGSATVYGETFMGFATASDLAMFSSRFPDLIIEGDGG